EVEQQRQQEEETVAVLLDVQSKATGAARAPMKGVYNNKKKRETHNTPLIMPRFVVGELLWRRVLLRHLLADAGVEDLAQLLARKAKDGVRFVLGEAGELEVDGDEILLADEERVCVAHDQLELLQRHLATEREHRGAQLVGQRTARQPHEHVAK